MYQWQWSESNVIWGCPHHITPYTQGPFSSQSRSLPTVQVLVACESWTLFNEEGSRCGDFYSGLSPGEPRCCLSPVEQLGCRLQEVEKREGGASSATMVLSDKVGEKPESGSRVDWTRTISYIDPAPGNMLKGVFNWDTTPPEHSKSGKTKVRYVYVDIDQPRYS